jgi:hypothetical protein
MTLPQFWAMIFGKQIVWDERARGSDKLAQRWVQRLRFSDTYLGLANLAQLLINALTGEVKLAPIPLSGKATYRSRALTLSNCRLRQRQYPLKKNVGSRLVA